MSTEGWVWTLDRTKSDFGSAGAPLELFVRLEQTDRRLGITMFIADADGQRVIQREALQPRLIDGAVAIVSDSTEDWRITALGELTITRTVSINSRPVQQRLLLSRASVLQ